jgi:hypothetical protein
VYSLATDSTFYSFAGANEQTYYCVYKKDDWAGEIQITSSTRWADAKYSLAQGLDCGDDMLLLNVKSQDIGGAVAVAEEAAKK